MVRRLTERDRVNVLEFLSKEPSINLFIIGDIEAFGFNEDFQTVWGQFSSDDNLEGVLLRFHESFIPYFTQPDFDITEFTKLILSNKGPTILSGKESILKKIEEVLPKHTSKTTYFCELADYSSLQPKDSSNQIKIATESDAIRIYELINQIEEFNGVGNSADRIEHKLRTKTGRIYYMENEAGTIVSVAQTTAENTKSAMVVGVATLKNYRGQGFISMCLSKLCHDVMSEGKTLCLFYDNPKAGSIYHKLGFKAIDNWRMITLVLPVPRQDKGV